MTTVKVLQVAATKELQHIDSIDSDPAFNMSFNLEQIGLSTQTLIANEQKLLTDRNNSLRSTLLINDLLRWTFLSFILKACPSKSYIYL